MDCIGTVPRANCGRWFSIFSTVILLIVAAIGSPLHAQYVSPFGVNSVTNKIYVANLGTSNTVTVIDGATGATATVPAGGNPVGVAVNSVTNKIYVIDAVTPGTVTVIDGATNATATVNVGSAPEGIAVNSVTNTIYVGNLNSRTVSVIDGATNAVTATVTVSTVSTTIQAIAVNSVTNTIYVVNSSNNTVTVINGATNATSTVNVGVFPNRVAVNSVTNTIYVVDTGGQSVTVINGATNTVTATVAVGMQPNDVALDSVTNELYVANNASQTVTVIDGASNATSTVTDGGGPLFVAVNSVTNKVYVLNTVGTVTVIDGAGGSTSPTPTPTPTPTPSGGGGGTGGTSGSVRLINISTRAEVGTGANILIPGFVISGSGTETLLIRADGPSLTQFGVSGVLAQPSLSVYNSASAVLASNTGWGTNTNPTLIASTAASVGAFAFASGSADCALVASLPAGAYTVQVSGVNGTTGVALAEVYEVSASGTRLANISTRAQVGTGGNILIPGFVISGSGTEQLLVRADGPGLTQFGVGGVLAQTSLSVYNSSGTVIASNTGWGTSSNPALIASTAASVGAFAFASGSADSAQIVNLPAGAYTIQVSGANSTTGVALAEVYEVP